MRTKISFISDAVKNFLKLSQYERTGERLKATHFIEVYKGKHSGEYHYCTPIGISLMEHQLQNTTLFANLETVAIFKIKMKTNGQ